MDKHRLFPTTLETLPPSEPFSFNYQPSRIDRNALFALNRTMDRNAISSARTAWHRAHLTFDELKADILEYDVTHVPRRTSPAYAMAIASVIEDLAIPEGTIIPLTHGAVANHPDFPKSKSPGLPYKNMGYKTKGEALADPTILNQIRKDWYSIERGHYIELPDSCAYARAQLCPRGENKVRATWGVPLSVIMTEGQYAYPFLAHLKSLERPILAYGLEMNNGGMSYINTAIHNYPNRPIFMGDWKKFDKRVPAWLIRDAFKIIQRAFDFSQVMDVEGKLWPVKPTSSNKRWRAMIGYFIDTPIRLSNGDRFLKHGGVPSGSLWTNIIDSIVNAIVMRYITYEMLGVLPIMDVYLGDDSLLILPELIDIEQFAQLAEHYFGFVLNTNKSYQTHTPGNVFFLGYFNDNGHPDKPIDTIVASSIYPERPCRNKIDTITRLVGQAYSTFEPIHSNRFFHAAMILAKEEDLEREDLEEWIHTHPSNFKFLQTLGIEPKTITIPDLSQDFPTMRTQPGASRRTFTHVDHDLDELYKKGLEYCSYLFDPPS